MNIKTLVISPHIDDEVLGCYTFLGPKTFVLYLGVEDRSYITASERKQELVEVSKKLGFQYEVLDFTVNAYQANALISPIEEKINQLKPDYILIPANSYNQDHRACHDAAITATRTHDQNFFVKNVLIYEQPQSILWPVASFNAQLFKPVDIQDKIRSYQLYESQVRGHRSPEFLSTLAALRGKQSNMDYAEAFEVRRMS
ncbi:PIG-L family deacetylase [Algoriphagus jejuensis]|uniref:PIG-L family deacetylase n=1 Tax=Algoriphagus jejuensis TaxID=419934 RepID=A0ABN1N0V3_9BACT